MSINLNVLNNPTTTGSEMSQLVEQLARRADVNGDGAVSTKEFSSFLTDLIQSLAGAQRTASGSGGTVVSEAKPRTDTPASTTPRAETPNTPRTSDPSVVATDAAVLPGWDPAKWVNPDHLTPKYVVGRILADYPPTPEGLKSALAEIQQALPGTTLAKNDTLDIPGVGMVDVGLSFDTGGNVGWWWGPHDLD